MGLQSCEYRDSIVPLWFLIFDYVIIYEDEKLNKIVQTVKKLMFCKFVFLHKHRLTHLHGNSDIIVQETLTKVTS